jgi:hypothetical protein
MPYIPAQIRNARPHHSRNWRHTTPRRPRWNRGWGRNVPPVYSHYSTARAARLFRAQEQQNRWRLNYANSRGFDL